VWRPSSTARIGPRQNATADAESAITSQRTDSVGVRPAAAPRSRLTPQAEKTPSTGSEAKLITWESRTRSRCDRAISGISA
jgi:hypothetical protein